MVAAELMPRPPAVRLPIPYIDQTVVWLEPHLAAVLDPYSEPGVYGELPVVQKVALRTLGWLCISAPLARVFPRLQPYFRPVGVGLGFIGDEEMTVEQQLEASLEASAREYESSLWIPPGWSFPPHLSRDELRPLFEDFAKVLGKLDFLEVLSWRQAVQALRS